MDKLRDRVRDKGLKTGEQAADALRDIIAEEMTPEAEMALDGKPAVILVIGVNGVGKTTSIAKLADYYTRQGKRVMLAAGDTFRAAASEQLEIWASRAGVPIVSAGEGADPAAVIFDTVKSATARGYDMVIADTAGRLHNKSNLMAELSKISGSVKKRRSPEASLETCRCWMPSPGRTPSVRPRSSARRKVADATGIILDCWTAPPRAAALWRSSSVWGLPVRFLYRSAARVSTTADGLALSPRRALWKSLADTLVNGSIKTNPFLTDHLPSLAAARKRRFPFLALDAPSLPGRGESFLSGGALKAEGVSR